MTPLGTYVVETLVTLLVIVALAVLVVVAGRRMGLGRPSGPMELIGKLPLEGRRAVYLVRVAKAVYVLGASEAGMRKLGELSPGELGPREESVVASRFADVLLGPRRRGAAGVEAPQEAREEDEHDAR